MVDSRPVVLAAEEKPVKVQTVMIGPDTDQYGGEGQAPLSISEITDAARKAEELGFDCVTTPEAGHDPFLPLALAAEHTRRINLGTNVAIAFPRSPMVTAQLAWDLQQLSAGRFQLGLGTQVRSHVERRYAARWDGPAGPRMREYVACVLSMFEVFAGDAKPAFEGEHYRFTLMNPFFNPGPIGHPRPAIHVAAVNPYMARLAGELCDGLRLHPIATFRFTRETVLPAVAKGAAKAGRDAGEVDLIGAPFLAVGVDDEAVTAAREALKQHIAFYASTPTYHSVLHLHGWGEQATALHQMSREGRWKEMSAVITDEMLDEWAVSCRKEDLAATLLDRCGGLFSTVLLDLPPALRRDEDWLRETIATLQRGG